jgi:hypothetical protein
MLAICASCRLSTAEAPRNVVNSVASELALLVRLPSTANLSYLKLCSLVFLLNGSDVCSGRGLRSAFWLSPGDPDVSVAVRPRLCPQPCGAPHPE